MSQSYLSLLFTSLKKAEMPRRLLSIQVFITHFRFVHFVTELITLAGRYSFYQVNMCMHLKPKRQTCHFYDYFMERLLKTYNIPVLYVEFTVL